MVKEIDIRLPLPPVDGYGYSEQEVNFEDNAEATSEIIQDFEDEEYVDSSSVDAGEALLPPWNMTILDQVTRITADGTTVTDLIVDVEGQPGALKYEVRVAKQ